MIDTSNASDVIREANHLLRKPKGNNGRSFRRFLSHYAPSGILNQVLTYDCIFTAAQLSDYEKYAEKMLAETEEFITQPCDFLEVIGVIRDDAFYLVQNAFRFTIPIKTATVPQLREMVMIVAFLAEKLEPVAYAKNTTVLWLNPDYVFRGLPQPNADAYTVTAFDNHQEREVKEWCVDLEDALFRAKLMSAHPRFSCIATNSVA